MICGLRLLPVQPFQKLPCVEGSEIAELIRSVCGFFIGIGMRRMEEIEECGALDISWGGTEFQQKGIMK